MEKGKTRKEVSELTGIPQRRILFYAEQTGLLIRLKRPGRGVLRRYGRLDIFELLLIQEFQDNGLSLEEVGRAVFLLQGLKDKWWDKTAQDFKRGPFYFILYRPKTGGGFLSGYRQGGEGVTLNMKRFKGAVVVDIGAVVERMPG